MLLEWKSYKLLATWMIVPFKDRWVNILFLIYSHFSLQLMLYQINILYWRFVSMAITLENGGKSMVMLLIPTFVLSFIGYHCDKKTLKHVKDNTIGDQNHLTEHQKMLLRIPLNAIKTSLISFLPYIIIPMVKYFGNVSDLTRFHCHIALFSFIQGSRIIIILTCLLKANKVNQIELSREQAREERRKWEQEG